VSSSVYSVPKVAETEKMPSISQLAVAENDLETDSVCDCSIEMGHPESPLSMQSMMLETWTVGEQLSASLSTVKPLHLGLLRFSMNLAIPEPQLG
jgi:hypothetical protein